MTRPDERRSLIRTQVEARLAHVELTEGVQDGIDAITDYVLPVFERSERHPPDSYAAELERSLRSVVKANQTLSQRNTELVESLEAHRAFHHTTLDERDRLLRLAAELAAALEPLAARAGCSTQEHKHAGVALAAYRETVEK